MSTCLYCAHDNRFGSLFCDNCGNSLLDATLPTLDTKNIPVSRLTPWEGEGTTRIDPHKSVLLYVRGATEPIEVKPAQHSIFLGRVRESSQLKPDIDLSAHQAFEKGVSKMHAVLRREKETLIIEDLGSANGTYVNGESLIPGHRHVLHHGDEVRLGHLLTNVYFS